MVPEQHLFHRPVVGERAFDTTEARLTDNSVANCASTGVLATPWMRIDLGGVYDVTNMSFVAFTSSDVFRNVEVRAGTSIAVRGGNANYLCGVFTVLMGQTLNVTCLDPAGQPVRARYINFFKPTVSDLGLCEVRVAGRPVPGVMAAMPFVDLPAANSSDWDRWPEDPIPRDLIQVREKKKEEMKMLGTPRASREFCPCRWVVPRVWGCVFAG